MTGRHRVGVIGVGAMGRNHARVYHDMPEAELVGVADVDTQAAARVADEYDAEPLPTTALLDRVDAVSIAVPTQYHYETARECVDAGVDVLIEKPFVAHPENGRRLLDLADRRGAIVQVGHIERFNPAVRTLLDLADGLDVIAVSAQRLGPPPSREIEDTAVMDLMIHDLDVLLALVDDEVEQVDAVGTADARYAAATLQFESGVVGQLTASRVTQEKVRQLTISAADSRVKLDYIDQNIEIHRQSAPEYVEDDGVRYRHENVVERLTVDRSEPLRNELESFVETSRTGGEPVVSGEDALRVLEVTQQIDALARDEPAATEPPQPSPTQD